MLIPVLAQKGNDIPRTIFIHQNGNRGQVFECSAERTLFIRSGFGQLGVEKISELPDMMFNVGSVSQMANSATWFQRAGLVPFCWTRR